MKNNAAQNTGSAAVRAPGPIENPALSFDLNAEIESLRKESAWQGGRNSKTLVKHPDFRVILTALQSKAILHEHKTVGAISVQTVAGHIRIRALDQVFDLPAGRLLALSGGVPHDVEALEESAFLLTIGWSDPAK